MCTHRMLFRVQANYWYGFQHHISDILSREKVIFVHFLKHTPMSMWKSSGSEKNDHFIKTFQLRINLHGKILGIVYPNKVPKEPAWAVFSRNSESEEYNKNERIYCKKVIPKKTKTKKKLWWIFPYKISLKFLSTWSQ